MRIEFPLRNSVQAAAVFSLILFAAPSVRALPGDGGAQAADALESSPRTALVIVAEHRLGEDWWAALFAALRANLPEAAAQFPGIDANPELIRADQLPYGAQAPGDIMVYLKGNCRAPLLLAPFPSGEALGWVLETDGHIASVIHVECTEIGEELSHRTDSMDRDQRDAAMSEAIARVILHEWVHIATQSAAHEKAGIGKASFGVNDLLSPEPGADRAREVLEK